MDLIKTINKKWNECYFKFIEDNQNKPWNWLNISENPNINWDFVKDNPDKAWEWMSLIRI